MGSVGSGHRGDGRDSGRPSCKRSRVSDNSEDKSHWLLLHRLFLRAICNLIVPLASNQDNQLDRACRCKLHMSCSAPSHRPHLMAPFSPASSCPPHTHTPYLPRSCRGYKVESQGHAAVGKWTRRGRYWERRVWRSVTRLPDLIIGLILLPTNAVWVCQNKEKKKRTPPPPNGITPKRSPHQSPTLHVATGGSTDGGPNRK